MRGTGESRGGASGRTQGGEGRLAGEAPEAGTGPAEETLERYAELAVRVGANVQPGQVVVLRAPLETAPFARRVAARAFAAGAHDVLVDLEDDQFSLLRHRLAPEAALAEYPAWKAAMLRQLAEGGAAFVSIAASDPDLLAGIDPGRIATASRARMTALEEWYRLISGMRTPWTIVSVPTAAWANRVFPNLPPGERVPRLWCDILRAVRVAEDEPLAAWREHLTRLGAAAAHLNARAFRTLRYRGPGTELEVDLPVGHRWISPPIADPRGIPFVPNMPTEEIFTLPRRDGVRGTVAASMPLNHRGVLIEGLVLRFEAGRVVAADARLGADTLRRLLASDEGSARLGEVALVPHGSAVSRLGTLFYNTLFDENAASHLALGRAYPLCLQGGADLGPEQLRQRGANTSIEHVDFMIGSAELSVDGLAADGSVVPVMRGGAWAFSL